MTDPNKWWDDAIDACAAELELMAIEQEQTNRQNPNHVEAYESWEHRPFVFRQAKARLEKLKGKLNYHPPKAAKPKSKDIMNE